MISIIYSERVFRWREEREVSQVSEMRPWEWNFHHPKSVITPRKTKMQQAVGLPRQKKSSCVVPQIRDYRNVCTVHVDIMTLKVSFD